VDIILDTAGQKGTGKWTSQAGLDLGIGIPQIAEAVFARCLSAIKEERVAASKVLKGPAAQAKVDKKLFVKQLEQAVYASKICSYAQATSHARGREGYKWDLHYGEIALVWAGVIIRARFLGKITEAFDANPELANLLLIRTSSRSSPRRRTRGAGVKTAVNLGIPLPAMSTALNYLTHTAARACGQPPAAQRDYFGAHTYERVDKPRARSIIYLDGERMEHAASPYTV
jgi:6-phosphogluconate dehydrogenase